MTELSLTVERTIGAPQERVFDAWLNPDMLSRFMLPGEGTSVASAKTDPKVGGRFELIMRAGEDDMPHAGTYKAIDPYNRIVFSWESPFSTEGSEVTLDFSPVADGTRLKLTHVRFPSEESRDNHNSGWTQILSVLAAEFE